MKMTILRRRFAHACRLGLCAVLTLAMLMPPARAASGPGIQILRDAEIEDTLRAFATPLLQAAGLNPQTARFVLVRDSAINAYVAGGPNVFVHTGLLQAATGPEQLVGVLAHEIGHISGGHLLRSGDAIRNASIETILGLVLGVAAGVATGNGNATGAVMSGAANIAQRSFLSFSRTQESSADAAALRFLDSAGWSARGLLTFFEKLQSQELLPTDRQVAFVRTHPLSLDRIEAVRAHIASSPSSINALPPDFAQRFERMKGKLLGYMQPEAALLRYGAADPRIEARYARVQALYMRNRFDEAMTGIQDLLKAEPDNPYFHEMKAQMLLENGKPRLAVEDYRRAVTLAQDSPLLRSALAHALLESQDPALLDEAVAQLQAALRQEPQTPSLWRLMATAWGRKGDQPAATYALAEEALARGDAKQARRMAEAAIKQLPTGSPLRLKAQDLRESAKELEKDAPERPDER